MTAPRPSAGTRAGSEDLRGRIERALGEGPERLGLAEAVSAGIEPHLLGMERSLPDLSRRHVSRVLAVVLCALGETRAAGRLLKSEGAMSEERADRFCRAVTEADAGTLRHSLLRAGWLSPRVDPADPEAPAWCLDLGALIEALHLETELEGMRLLDRIACDLAPLWSESGGRGRLFLKGLSRVAAVWGTRPAQRRRLRLDVPGRMAQRLNRLAATHAWRQAPDVVKDDFTS